MKRYGKNVTTGYMSSFLYQSISDIAACSHINFSGFAFIYDEVI